MNATQEQAMRPETMPAERDCVSPNVNIFESNEGYLLEADMPGVNKEGLEVLLEGNSLTLVGRRAPAEAPQGNLIHRESLEADYRRVFELDPAIDTKKIAAHMEQGVLRITLPKAEKVKPRKIAVAE
jgi:HSP20 family protein